MYMHLYKTVTSDTNGACKFAKLQSWAIPRLPNLKLKVYKVSHLLYIGGAAS